MPHDANNIPINVGDIVRIDCEVISVTPNEDYCNVTVKPIDGPENMRNSITLNTRATHMRTPKVAEAP
jgi:hypothetical protein